MYVGCEKYDNPVFKDIPYLDVTAVLNESAKTLIVNVVNRHETNALLSDVVLQSGEFTGNATVKQINAEGVSATNTRTNETVAIATKEIRFQGNKISFSFPAHSFTQILISVK